MAGRRDDDQATSLRCSGPDVDITAPKAENIRPPDPLEGVIATETNRFRR